MMQGISPFEMEIQALEGKFKLGQERSEGDRNGVLAHLAARRLQGAVALRSDPGVLQEPAEMRRGSLTS